MENLNELKNRLLGLRNLYKLPSIFIEEYFTKLAEKVEDALNKKYITASNYRKITNTIELFKDDCIDNISDDDFKHKIDQEILSIEMQIDTFLLHEETKFEAIKQSISKTENEIKKYLFSNQTIFLMTNYSKEKKTFLLVIKDEYFSAETFSFLDMNTTACKLSNEVIKMLDLKKELAKGNNLVELKLDFNLIQKLDLSYSKISSFEMHAFAGLEYSLIELDLDGNQIKIINSKIFQTLSNLKSLNLFDSKIDIIEDNAFYGLESLERLNLDNNNITEINGLTFTGLNKLLKLVLSKNKINHIEDNSFQCLSSLNELYLFSNKIKEINQYTFFGLTELVDLNLNDNQLSKIEKNTFDRLLNLKQLKLTRNRIQKLHEYAFEKASNLEGIDLRSNRLSQINSKSFIGLSKLKVLNLWSNSLKTIDEKPFECLTELEFLYLSNNKLERINGREVFFGLKNLKGIDLHRNELTFIDPKLFSELNNLVKLDISENNLSMTNQRLFYFFFKIKLKFKRQFNMITTTSRVSDRKNSSFITNSGQNNNIEELNRSHSVESVLILPKIVSNTQKVKSTIKSVESISILSEDSTVEPNNQTSKSKNQLTESVSDLPKIRSCNAVESNNKQDESFPLLSENRTSSTLESNNQLIEFFSIFPKEMSISTVEPKIKSFRRVESVSLLAEVNPLSAVETNNKTSEPYKQEESSSSFQLVESVSQIKLFSAVESNNQTAESTVESITQIVDSFSLIPENSKSE